MATSLQHEAVDADEDHSDEKTRDEGLQDLPRHPCHQRCDEYDQRGLPCLLQEVRAPALAHANAPACSVATLKSSSTDAG